MHRANPRLRPVAVVLALAGCAERPETRSVVVTGAPGPTRIAFGGHWLTDRSTVSHEVPASAGVVTAYVDRDGGGGFERYAEPSADCTLDNDTWRCAFQPRTLTLHRIVTHRGAEKNDKTVLFWETDDGAPACVGERCTRVEDSPFVNGGGKVAMISICDGQGFPTQAARYATPTGEVTHEIDHPPMLALATSATRAGRTLQIALTGPVRPTRVLVWAARFAEGSPEPSTLLWTSEDRPLQFQRAGDTDVITVGAVELEDCTRHADCEIVVQAFASWPRQAPLRSLTELRAKVWP